MESVTLQNASTFAPTFTNSGTVPGRTVIVSLLAAVFTLVADVAGERSTVTLFAVARLGSVRSTDHAPSSREPQSWVVSATPPSN